MPLLLEAGTWLGACALYFAFAAAQGATIRHMRMGKSLRAAAAASAIYLPATVLFLRYEPWRLAMRMIPVATGLLVLALFIWRPSGIRPWWQRSVVLRYLASTMAISALAQIGLAWASASAAAAVVAAAAVLAGWASLRASSRVSLHPV